MTKHKSDLTAETLKITGSSKFSKRYFQDALINYNEGLCRAESNFLKSLLYGNRSAVYFEVGKYKECIENIQLAKEHGYPADKIDKLNKREEKCLKTMESKQSKVEINKNEPFSDFIKLSYKGHDKIPFIIEEIEKRNSKKYGNYLITTKDLKTGDIIAIEEPFVKIIDREYKYERCSYCLKQNSYNFIPCDHCCEGKKSRLKVFNDCFV
jgi:SET and MYND domain-containing protein 4